MKLEKLELFGFKSFADKEEFIFEPGITVIVGPNGCGKSNVIDAIKWVLGEQSVKALRGNEMSDVIFGGGGSRPAMGFAEASLTMSNEDHLLPIEYDEVSITRRLYTSGESEYLINKNICRLKDIKELFLGTGVGVNSFSIIEQGKVEAILQANTYEKRHVFEEAAGISKFKARKKETLLKLEKTQQNLLRVNDIVREVERQLRSIKIQAGKASRYKEFSERLQELKIKLSLKNFQDLRNSKHDVINEIGLLSNNSKEVLSTIDSMEVDVLDLDNQLSGIDQKMSEANTDIASSDAQITNIKDKMNFCHERLEDIKQLESNYDEDVKTLKAKIEENEIKLINVKKDLENIEHGFNIDTEALASKETALDQIILETDMLTERVEEMKSEIMAVFHDQSKIQNEIGNQATINETLENRKHKIENAQEDIFNQINSVGQNLQTLKDKHSGFICETENFGKEQSGLKDAVNTLDNEIRTIDSEIGQQERTRSSKQSRLEVLEDYETRAEGVDAGAKEILNRKDSFTGIFGLIADIIKVELPYAKAIETALGDLAQSVATGCYDDSIKAINFLKETDAGHATFLLIDKLKESNASENQRLDIQDQKSEIRNPKSEIGNGIIGKASDLVKYDNEFKAVVEFLLGKTLVVQDFNKATSLMNSIYQNDDNADLIKTGYGDINRIVTLDGALIEKAGIIKGGVIREKPGLILRKSEMQSIHVEISGIDLELEKLQQERTLKTSDLNKSRESMDLTTEKLEKLNIVLLNSGNEQKQETQTISKLNEEKEINTGEIQEIKRDIDSIAERNLELRDKLCAANKQHEELEKEISVISEEVSEKEDIKTTVQEDITALKITIAQKNEKREAFVQTVQHTELNNEEFNSQLNSRLSGIEESKTKKQNIAIELEELDQNTNDVYSKKKAVEDLLNTLVTDHDSASGQLSDRRTELGNFKTKHSDINDQVHKLQIKENEYQVRATDLEDRIFEEYNIKLSELVESQCTTTEESNYASVNNTMVKNIEEGGTERLIGTTDTQTESAQDENYGSDIPTDIDNNEEIDWDAVSAEMEELKTKIDKIGSVNMDSINEHEEFEERYQFLTTQRDDLEESEKSLHEIIEKLSHTSRELFEKTFNEIREHFSTYFRKLFGGGKADIILEDGVDILDAGIDIVVQPPNKEFKSLALFSGGEKVMITVALLFAILKTKPTPFCLMDEIDAALDENNISRFTTVLKEFAIDSQFIIISHNKKTMNIADVIYGVTMEEPGISKKVAVKFDGFE